MSDVPFPWRAAAVICTEIQHLRLVPATTANSRPSRTGFRGIGCRGTLFRRAVFTRTTGGRTKDRKRKRIVPPQSSVLSSQTSCPSGPRYACPLVWGSVQPVPRPDDLTGHFRAFGFKAVVNTTVRQKTRVQ